MDDINKNNNSEINSLATEATPKNTELDIFVDLLRQADVCKTKSGKKERENAINCYEKALYGDGEGFKGFFVETIFKVLGQDVIAYAKHNFDLTKIEDYLNKINKKIKESHIVEKELIDIYQLTFVIDQAVKNQFADQIEDLVEKARTKYPLPKDWDSQAESYDNSYDEMYEDQISYEDDDFNESSKNALYKLWMRITTYDYIKLIKSQRKNHSEKEKKVFETKKEFTNKFEKLVERVIEETTEKNNDLKNFKDTERNLSRKALPFCNLVTGWINNSEYKKDNYRKAIPHLYDAINVLWSDDHKNDERYNAKSFLFKTISNVQLKRISARVNEDKMLKAKEYFFTLLENLIGKTPSDKEQESLTEKYGDDESFDELKDKLKKSFADVLLNDTSNIFLNEHRGSFLKGIIEFCNDTLYLINEKDSYLYKRIKDIFKLFAEATYDKLFLDGIIKYPKMGLDNYYQAYYCAEIFYAIKGRAEENKKLNSCIAIAKQIQIYSNAKDEEKMQLKERLTSLEIRRVSYQKSNLNVVLKNYKCQSSYDLVMRLQNGVKLGKELNRQAYYDILNDLYVEKKLGNDNLKIIKEGLSESKFSYFLINKILTNTESIKNYRDKIIQFILSHAALLEANLNGHEIPETVAVSDEALTLLVLQILPKILNDIEKNELKKMTEIICDNFGSEFERKDAAVHFAILQLLCKVVIKKNSLDVMSILMKRMTYWRRNYEVDNEMFKLLIYFLWNRGLSTKDDYIEFRRIENRLNIYFNPFLAQNVYNLIKEDKVLKAHINDYIYGKLMDIINKNTEKLYSDKKVFNLLNTVGFQLELGKIDDAKKTFKEAQAKNDHQKFGNKFTCQFKAISKLMEDAESKANEGLNRFKSDNDEWDVSSMNDEDKKLFIEKKIQKHNTQPMRRILYYLRGHKYIKFFVHRFVPDQKTSIETPEQLIEKCKPLLETTELMLNESLPFDFGKTLYDYYSSTKWNCWESSNNTFIQRPSLNQCESFNKTYEDGLKALNKLLTIEGALNTFKTARHTSAPLTLDLGAFEKSNVIRAGQSDKGYRTYLPSIQKAIKEMESETEKHTIDGKMSTLIPRLTASQDLYIELINPYPSNAKNLDEFMNNIIEKRWGGSYEIVKSLWGVCDFAIQCRYYNEDTKSYILAHKDILGEIYKFNDEKYNDKVKDSEEWFKYIIRIPDI